MSASSGNTSGFMSDLRSRYASGGNLSVGQSPASDPNPTPSQVPNQPQVPSQSQQLQVAEQVLNEFNTSSTMGSLAQVMPQTLTTVLPDPLNPPNPTPVGQKKKEVYQVGPAVAEAPAPSPEYPTGVQSVEQEPTPEISPEVESFLKHAEQQPDQLPQEIVIADNQDVSSVAHHPKQPVVVLPISAQDQAVGAKKDFKFSIRWLVEFSVKIMKKFSGQVIYREETTTK